MAAELELLDQAQPGILVVLVVVVLLLMVLVALAGLVILQLHHHLKVTMVVLGLVLHHFQLEEVVELELLVALGTVEMEARQQFQEYL